MCRGLRAAIKYNIYNLHFYCSLSQSKGGLWDGCRCGIDGDGTGRYRSPEDLRLWEVLQQLVEYRGRMRAATALGVNYRTVAKNLEAGSLSRRMRRALHEFEAGLEPAESPDLDGSRSSGGRTETVAQQMETLAGEVGHLAEMVEAQGGQLQELGRTSGGTGGRRQGADRRKRWAGRGRERGRRMASTGAGAGDARRRARNDASPSPTRSTRSGRQLAWWPSGGICAPAYPTVGVWTGLGPRNAGGNWGSS